MSGPSSDPATYFREIAREHSRCFWLDGGGAREWSGRRSLIGWLEEADVSLSFSAARGEVTRHQDGESLVVGVDVFAALEAELASGAEGDQWFGYFGYASRPDLPAAGDPDLPDSVWLRARHVRLFDHPARPADPLPATADAGSEAHGSVVVPDGVRSGPGGAARRQLLRGEPDLPARDGKRPAPG